jgi:hypothetical protein
MRQETAQVLSIRRPRGIKRSVGEIIFPAWVICLPALVADVMLIPGGYLAALLDRARLSWAEFHVPRVIRRYESATLYRMDREN